MTEPNNEPKPEPTPATPAPEPERESPAFLGLKSEVTKSNERATKAEQALKDLKASIADKDAAAETARLESEGNYKAIAEAAEAKTKALEASHTAELKRMNLNTALLQAGIDNEFTRDGIIGKCPADTEPADYIASLKESMPALFAAPGMSRADAPSQGGASGGDKPKNLDERLVSDDPAVREAARKEKFNELTGSS